MIDSDWATATALLRCSAQLVDGIQAGLVARGFTDVRPAYGFAFAFLSGGAASASALGEHLAVSKQAAGQLVDQLVARGYVERQPDPRDGRAWLLVLTDRGWACTRAAEQAAGDVVAGWRAVLPSPEFAALSAAATRIGGSGRLRPSW
ncbi:MarR family protein [Jatrophihabitans endophyticus]|uniref:MarR family protein n=1 Tax=Jatrophihabitans endophyticus TaxID=1206085 RepID=A0A1M5T7E0_9ACTN|nr:MarR family transcriptional regulator [Jatrophihabitans endophyticus]SHH46303.1 MarR family protein [Jatrophihabitans endophyticus]